ncbi:tyrosine-type recombinase/integrase [Burkholderia multivorans]|uniref:tyrosine-type recombinase/integrase n=1 Tax=Burkholderia multivorans TaxID=87883 RepID=UPI0013DE8575|nr:integrase family protein [Burkholderia multivorans]NGM78756.1 integrase family protein [Burkholderia multivorans]
MASEKVNFTAERVASFPAVLGKTQTLYWDGKVPGLGLRVTPAGARAYIFESRLFGQTVRITIGNVRAWSLGDARIEAARLKTKIDAGIDPREERAAQEAAHAVRQAEARRQVVVVAEAWAEYLVYLRTTISPKTKRLRSVRYIADHEALASPGGETKKRGKGLTVAGPLAPLMVLKLNELTDRCVAEWLAEEADERPTNAAHAFRLLRAFVHWLAGRDEYKGVVPDDACDSPKVQAVLPASNAKDGDCLQREQLAGWFSAVRQVGNPVTAAYLQGLLLNGPRRSELAALRWDDVDFRWHSVTLADKVEGTRVIPLTPYFESLLLELDRLNNTPPDEAQLKRMKEKGEDWKPSEWVFASRTSASGHIEEPRFQHAKALEEAGIPHVTVHGLRRSFGTLSEWCEVPIGIVAQIQGHKPSALAEKHYRRRPLDLLRLWHRRIETWMLEQAGIDFMPEAEIPDLRLPALELKALYLASDGRICPTPR